jgi:glutamate/tyrosine decarboxylase-like PLP-dependent enzyme
MCNQNVHKTLIFYIVGVIPLFKRFNYFHVKVCWEKFARYFEVELKEVKLSEGYYVMDPKKAVDLVDENTICVAAILGSTLNGEFEDVKTLNDLLVEKNKETGYVTYRINLQKLQ